MRKRKESLGEFYELCENSSFNCSTYADLAVIFKPFSLHSTTQLQWRLMGFNDPKRQLFETSDVASVSPTGQEKTDGTLEWSDGEGGARIITLTVKPYTQPEIQKYFWISIYDVLGQPPSTGSGDISKNAGTVRLTVRFSCFFQAFLSLFIVFFQAFLSLQIFISNVH